MVREVKSGEKCQFEGCEAEATQVACGRAANESYGPAGHPRPNVYCDAHGYQVSDERSPEYIVECPNCGCGFGVN